MNQFIGVAKGRGIGVDPLDFSGFIPCLFKEFSSDALLRTFSGIHFAGRDFQGLPSQSIPELPDHQDFLVRKERNDRGRFRVIDPYSLAHLVVLQQNLIEIG